MDEKRQIVWESMLELLGLLENGESLNISRVPVGDNIFLSVITVADVETRLLVPGGSAPAILLASRM